MSEIVAQREVQWKAWPQPRATRLSVASTSITSLEANYIEAALASNWIGPNGSFNRRAEEILSQLTGRESLLTSSGTAALYLALVGLGIGPGDEVLVPATTFAATANAVVAVGARPIFVDVEPRTWGIDAEAIVEAITPKTRAVIAVHLYGMPCEIERVSEITRQSGRFLIEDCAEAPFASVNGRQVGSWGDVATYSFFANKLVTAGEGGAVSAADPELLERMRLIRGQGMDPHHRYLFKTFGMNLRLSNLSAALLTAQLERLSSIWQGRQELECRYDEALKGLVDRPDARPGVNRSPWIFTGLLNQGAAAWDIANVLASAGVETRPVFYPLPTMPAFHSYASTPTPVSTELALRGLSLPTGAHIGEREFNEIVAHTVAGLDPKRRALR